MKKSAAVMLGATVLVMAGCTAEVEPVGGASAALLDVNVSLMQADGGEEDGTILW